MKRVYFIKPIGMDGPIKIGCSYSPTKRINVLAYWSPFPLEIIAEFEGGYSIERRFHAKFEHLFQGHEWFRIAPDLAETIEQIKAGTFDVSNLPEPKVLYNNNSRRSKAWTPEARLRASLTHRCGHMRRRSGFYFRNSVGPTTDVAELAARVSDYLAAPHIHGVPCMYGEEKRIEWLAAHAPVEAAA